ncbi:MAG: hypothetical protein FJ027_07970 [Candidatus Rokubacteria bacterium]|nr:hypothetical protein [Candidatus Rokubacteria bacterium]
MSDRVRDYSHGPIQHRDAASSPLFRRVRTIGVLLGAWRVVRENGLSSPNQRTRSEVRSFEPSALRHLRRIQTDLKSGRFEFDPQIGILQPRPGKKPRPIVVATLKNRIVQRAILDVVQDTPVIQQILATPTSYGGIKGRGRDEAVLTAYEAANQSATFYLRSDIADFFTGIPREKVHTYLATSISDHEFLRLFRSATETELSNMAQLRSDLDHFPVHEIGVAQGCALSPLLGNVLLSEFDKSLNGRGIVCLRYIDDFLILGRNRRSVLRAFESARILLNNLGLKAYDPRERPDKAAMGDVDSGFDFLGYNVRPGMIRPSQKSQTAFRNRIQRAVADGRRDLRRTFDQQTAQNGLASILCDISNVVRGWGHSFALCNSRDITSDLDEFVDRQINDLLHLHTTLRNQASALTARRLIGVQLLEDIPNKPFVLRMP